MTHTDQVTSTLSDQTPLDLQAESHDSEGAQAPALKAWAVDDPPNPNLVPLLVQPMTPPGAPENSDINAG